MRNFVLTIITVCTWAVFLSSCNGGRTHATLPDGDTLNIRHASHLQVVEYPGYTVATLRNPWDTLMTLHTYVLIPHGKEYTADTLPVGTVVRVPLQRSVIYTAVHCGLVDELGALDAVAGVCDAEYIHLPIVQQRLQQGEILDLGNAQGPNIERMIDLRPDALLLSPFENSGGYGRADKLGVPVIECADYMETSALGRAEWMRFYGRLYGRADEADSLFAIVESDYERWKAKAQTCTKRPIVFADLPIGSSAWYVSGGGSTIGRMYADAGARYLFADNPNSGSVPLSFETVYAKAHEADIWLIRYHATVNRTYGSLADENDAYTKFSAYRERRMYGCNTAYSRFYDEVPFHPERLLAEFACIFHPELAEETDSLAPSRYYTPLAE